MKVNGNSTNHIITEKRVILGVHFMKENSTKAIEKVKEFCIGLIKKLCKGFFYKNLGIQETG